MHPKPACLEHSIKSTSSQRIGRLVLRLECINGGAIAGIGIPDDNSDSKNDANTIDFYYHRCLYRAQLGYYVVEDEVGRGREKKNTYFANGQNFVECSATGGIGDVGAVFYGNYRCPEEFGLPGERKELLARA